MGGPLRGRLAPFGKADYLGKADLSLWFKSNELTGDNVQLWEFGSFPVSFTIADIWRPRKMCRMKRYGLFAPVDEDWVRV